MRIFTKILFLIVLASLSACIGSSDIKDSPTSGTAKVGADESFKPVIEAQVELYEGIYHYAVVKTTYGPESEIVDLFLKDSVRVMVLSRELTEAEEQYLVSHQFVPKTTKIAFDALAFIVNKNNPDSQLRYDQVRDIFEGKISKWGQINPQSPQGDMDVIFDNNKSGNPRYIREKFKIEGNFPENCYAVHSNEEVIKFVERNPHALGIISVNWISDEDDSTANTFMKSIKVAGIGLEGDTEGAGHFYKPYPAYIAQGSYPFCREIFMINRETFAGTGTGFVQFVAGEKGQLVVLKAGLVPATMPVRIHQFKN